MRSRRGSVFVLGVTLAVAVAGGAAPPPAAAATAADSAAVPSNNPVPVEAPARAMFPSMKHVWQSLNNCGPAAVVMALSTLGVDVDQETARIPLRGADVRRGMGPQGVSPWVGENWGLRSTWRNNGTIDTLRTLVANGFAPMVTQWMQDYSISRIGHWRTVRGYDDGERVFYVNDSMLGNGVPLAYDWFNRNWQSFNYRYMVIYRPEDEALLNAIMGPQVSDEVMRRDLYERAKREASVQNTNLAWLALGEASYSYGMFDEAVAAFEKGLAMGNASGVFGTRNSYPQALRALGRREDADKVQQALSGLSLVPAAAAAPPDPFALWLAYLHQRGADSIQLTP
jgi:hypothetical protein